jgi:O-methyltransferase
MKILFLIASFVRPVRWIKYRMVYRSLKDYTMIPQKLYFANLDLCRFYRKIEGDIVECGTWRGGMIAGMVSILGADQKYYLFDSFEGLPEVEDIDGKAAKAWQTNKNGVDYFDNCRADESEAQKAMIISGAKNFTIHKGWFNESLKSFSSPNGIAILRLDADWYNSTMDCLTNLFPKINNGGILIVDDYYTWEGCAKAIHDYLSSNKLPYRINSYQGVCFIIKN